MTKPVAVLSELIEVAKAAYEISGSPDLAKSRIGCRFSYRSGVISRLVHGLTPTDGSLMGLVVADVLVAMLVQNNWSEPTREQMAEMKRVMHKRLAETGRSGLRCLEAFDNTAAGLLFPEETPT